ncbi:hypothetical protein B566_EDAN005291 [Ephemera danica]|nr:hypothetical protein B566_EDAN005291 [Ephemera danica]
MIKQIKKSWAYFLAFILLENVVLFLEGKPTIRINDGVTSLSHGIIHQCGKLLFRGAENALYIYVYERWRLFDIDWESATTWYLAALGVDFCYYWVHRASHGCNIYCLDKNYGGVLIVWDRMFGTFAAPRPNEEIIYGLVLNQPSFNPLWLQTFYTAHVVSKWRAMIGWRDKLSAVVKGPSWAPGSPWTGREEDKIDVRERDKFDVALPLWCNVYVLVHFAVLRCVVLAALVRRGALTPLPSMLAPALQLFFALSAILCTLHTVQPRDRKEKTA